jgi:aspartate/methionine/tyrosine aminotransferase
VIHLEVGEPDFSTPEPIVAAAQVAIAAGKTKYTPAPGIPELRQAISAQYHKTHGLEVDPNRIFVTAGGSGALLLAMALTIDPGAGMLMTDPGYPCNRNFVRSFDGEAQLVPVGPEQNYQLDKNLVVQHWQDNTRAVLLASPANPTGSVLARSEMSAIAEFVKEKSGFLIVDEIYHGLHYGESYPCSGLEFDGIVVNSFSKYYGMTGWRLGWLVVPEEAAPHIEKLAQNLFICPSAISQYAALAAFSSESISIMEEQRLAFKQRRDLLLAGLRALNFHVPDSPEGAFYVYAGLPESTAMDSEAFCSRLLEEFGVAVTAGADFGDYKADRHIRVSYANDLPALERALEAFAQALK